VKSPAKLCLWEEFHAVNRTDIVLKHEKIRLWLNHDEGYLLGVFSVNLNYYHQVPTNAGSIHQADTISTCQIFLQKDTPPL
jgi:hypothetical protein